MEAPGFLKPCWLGYLVGQLKVGTKLLAESRLRCNWFLVQLRHGETAFERCLRVLGMDNLFPHDGLTISCVPAAQ